MSLAHTSNLRVLIVDDHQLVRAGIRLVLQQYPRISIIGEASGREDSLAIVQTEQPDIILLDLDLKTVNGLDFLPDLLQISPQSRVIILTSVYDPDAHLKSIGLGAMGVVLKEEAPDILVKAIHKVHTGEVWIDRSMTAKVLSQIANTIEKINPEVERASALTEREKDVVSLIGEGLKNKAIAQRLFISEGTVRHHLTSIFDKLGVTDRLELVIYAYRYGLIKVDRPKS